MTTYYQQLNQYNRYCRYPQMLKRATVFGDGSAEVNMTNNDEMMLLQKELFDHMDPVGKRAITTHMKSNPGWPHPSTMIAGALQAGGGDNELATWLYSTLQENPDYFNKYPKASKAISNEIAAVKQWINDKAEMPLEFMFGPDGWFPWRGPAKELRGYLGIPEPGTENSYDPDAELTEEEGEGAEVQTDTPVVENPGTPPTGPDLANNYILPTALLAAPVALGGALSGNVGGGLLGAGLIGLAGLGYGRARQTGWKGWKPVEDVVNKVQNWETMKEWNKALGIQTYLPPAAPPTTQTPPPTTQTPQAPQTPTTQTPPPTTQTPQAPQTPTTQVPETVSPTDAPGAPPNTQAWRAPGRRHPRNYSPGPGLTPQYANFSPQPNKPQGPFMNNGGPQFAYKPGPKPRNPFPQPTTQLWGEQYV